VAPQFVGLLRFTEKWGQGFKFFKEDFTMAAKKKAKKAAKKKK
jgi:hypothetical protein